MLVALLVVGAYLLGSVSSAILVSRALGLPDPRTTGSRNPGATNVLRIGGRKAAAVTLLGDLLKGVVPVVAGHALGIAPPALTAIGAAAFAGHVFPLYYGFAGGKGVATFIGVGFALQPWLGAMFVAVWLLVAALTRYSSLAALLATAATPLGAWWLGQPMGAIALFVAMAVLIFWRHRPNIRKLLAGEESKIGQRI